MSDIKGLLIRILQSEFANKYAIVGKVVSVDGNNVIIENVESKAVYSNVRLQANPGNGILIIPSVDSFVIVGRLTGNAGYIAMVSDADSIQMLDGSYGGLIKIDELVTKLNILEQDLNTLRDQFDSWVPVPNDGGLVLKNLLTPTWTVPQLTETVNADLENEDITHGTVS
jgi:hypothetical protein